MTILSPSRLTVLASGIQPAGSRKSKNECRCAMCGTTIFAGDLIDDFAPGDAFTDYPALAAKSSDVICADCKAIWRQEFLQKYSKSVICDEGVFPFAKMENQAYWLLNPPQSPFIMILSDQQQQHLIWRAPVNLSRDLYQIRFGSALLTIRRLILVEAMEASRYLVELLNATEKKPRTKSPFVRLDWEMSDLRHGRLRDEVLSLPGDEAQKMVGLLRSLTPGESWALCVLLAGKEPVRPEPVLTPKTGLPKSI